MSAFMVGADHIDALLTFAITPNGRDFTDGVRYFVNDNAVEITADNADEVGRILLTENERSIRARYSDAEDMGLGEAEAYTFERWTGPLDAVAILKGCDCFDYQACETDDYRASLAFTIVNAIRNRAISRLPGYDAAKAWTFVRAEPIEKKPAAPSLPANVARLPVKPRPRPANDDTGISF